MRCSNCKENREDFFLHRCIDCGSMICNKCIHNHQTKISLLGNTVCECPICIPNNPSRFRRTETNTIH